MGVRFIVELEAGKPTLRVENSLRVLHALGGTLAQAFELLRRATRPSAPHLLRLLDVAVFNALIGNHDAHGKNFSLLYAQPIAQPTALAPLYDTLCTAVYPHLTDKMAMKLGSQYRYTEVMARHWEQFAREAGLSAPQVKRRVLELAKRPPALAHHTQAQLAQQGHHHPILAPKNKSNFRHFRSHAGQTKKRRPKTPEAGPPKAVAGDLLSRARSRSVNIR